MTALGILFRVYLFAGLAAHKVLWELLKRNRDQSATQMSSGEAPFLRIVKAGKITVTVGLFVQLFLPEILPIRDNALIPRVAGVTLFTLGLLLAIMARLELGNNWSDIEAGLVKQDHMLVNRGVYRYIRHPIYTGDLVMLLGFEFCLNSWLFIAVLIIAVLTIYKAIREEKVLAETVTGYEAYRAQTKRFIPFVI